MSSAEFPPVATSQGVVQAKNELAVAQRAVNQLSQTLLDKHPDLLAARESVTYWSSASWRLQSNGLSVSDKCSIAVIHQEKRCARQTRRRQSCE